MIWRSLLFPFWFNSPILKKVFDYDGKGAKQEDKLSRGQKFCHKFYEIPSIMNVPKYMYIIKILISKYQA